MGMWWACGGHEVGIWWEFGGHLVGVGTCFAFGPDTGKLRVFCKLHFNDWYSQNPHA